MTPGRVIIYKLLTRVTGQMYHNNCIYAQRLFPGTTSRIYILFKSQNRKKSIHANRVTTIIIFVNLHVFYPLQCIPFISRVLQKMKQNRYYAYRKNMFLTTK